MENNSINVTFSPEDLHELNDARIALEQAIVTRLKRAGIYYRSFSRVKAEDSLNRKLATGKYGEDKKVQDLIGIRINLYYYEDINICERILEQTFQNQNWSKSANGENTFTAQKRNGVFTLPTRYANNISNDVWDKPIDQTFEVQLRTLLFEGWHEVEHDMRYKFKSDKDGDATPWDDNKKLSRVMNSIIANLELCDWSIGQIFDNIAEDQLADKNWEFALKSKYRIKINQDSLKPEVKRYFENNSSVAERFFQISKQRLVDILMMEKGNYVLSPNSIIYVMNKYIVRDFNIDKMLATELKQSIAKKDVSQTLEPLKSDYVFTQEIFIRPEGFDIAAKTIYEWAYNHVKPVFNQMPENICTCHYEVVGYKLTIEYEPENRYLFMDLQHLSNVEAGVIWHTKAELNNSKNGILLRADNICETLNSRTRHYNRPRFMRDIYRTVGFIDAGRMLSIYDNMKDIVMDYKTLDTLVHSSERRLPIIAIMKQSEIPEWAIDYKGHVIDVTKLHDDLEGICHVICCSEKCINDILERYPQGTKEDAILVWPKDKVDPRVFNLDDIKNSRFDESYAGVSEENEYEKSFRYKLKEIVKNEFKM